MVRCHAVNQITLTESCPKNGDVSEVSGYKKSGSLMLSAGAKGDGTSMGAHVTLLSIGAELSR
jgi:hypothetical protein